MQLIEELQDGPYDQSLDYGVALITAASVAAFGPALDCVCLQREDFKTPDYLIDVLRLLDDSLPFEDYISMRVVLVTVIEGVSNAMK
jgi:hypothetical protein